MSNNDTRKYNHRTLMKWEEDANIMDVRIALMIGVSEPTDSLQPCVIYSRLPPDDIIHILEGITKQLKAGNLMMLRAT